MHNFRPFRYSNKNEKIIVTDYLSWNKARCCSEYRGEQINITEDVTLVLEDGVFDYKLRPLYFPILNYEERILPYHAPGYDCNGTPALSHYSGHEYASDPKWERLTTSRVVREFNDWLSRNNINTLKLIAQNQNP